MRNLGRPLALSALAVGILCTVRVDFASCETITFDFDSGLGPDFT